MEIVLIAALNRARVIGCGGRTPWRHAADMRFFRRTTHGHPVVMGRVTYASLPRVPLPGRANLVLSRRAGLPLPPGAVHCRSLPDALQWCRRGDCPLVFVAGGAQVYQAALPLATCMLLTWVPDEVCGDAFFPAFDPVDWDVIDTRRDGELVFATYRRPAAGPAGA